MESSFKSLTDKIIEEKDLTQPIEKQIKEIIQEVISEIQ